jgi:hypothetical protein
MFTQYVNNLSFFLLNLSRTIHPITMPIKKYSTEQLQEAVKKVMAGEISQKKSSTFYQSMPMAMPTLSCPSHDGSRSRAWQGDILF